jgi:protein O-GlcNAc transferase
VWLWSGEIRRRVWIGAVVVALLRGNASSQEVPESLKQADAAYKSGQAALARRDLQAARVEFAKVVRLAPQAEQGHSALGAVLVSLGERAMGIRELERALAIQPGDGSAQMNLALAYEQSGAGAKALPLFAKAEAGARSAGKVLPPYALAAYARALSGTQPEMAVAKMKAAIAGEASNAVLHDELGSLFAQRADWASAEPEFAEAVRLKPADAAAHWHLGLALKAQGKPGSLKELARAEELDPDNAGIGLEYGKALAGADRDPEAISLFQGLHQAHPESVEVEYELALALQRTGQVKAAIDLLEKVVAAEPKDADALANLGMALTQAQRAKDGVPRLQEAVRLAPELMVAHQDLAAAYIQLNQLDEAIAQLKIALALAPDSAQLHYNLGLAYKMQDEATKAIPELETAEKQNPQAPEPAYLLGVLYMQTGRYEEAARELSKSLKLHPENGDGWATLGSVYAKLEKLPAATEALREAIRQLPEQPDPHLTLAGVLVKEGQTAEAAAERKQAAELMRAKMNRQRAEVASNSAKSLLQSGKVEDSIAQYKEALSYDPGYAEAHRGLAAALDRQGNATEATAERQKANSLEGAPRQ